MGKYIGIYRVVWGPCQYIKMFDTLGKAIVFAEHKREKGVFTKIQQSDVTWNSSITHYGL